MPDVLRLPRVVVLMFTLAVLPLTLAAQQKDSTAVRDSVRRDSIARADSLRADSVMRRELARIKAEPRALQPATDSLRPLTGAEPISTARHSPRGSILAASIAGDMIADLSPSAAARPAGTRIRTRDIEGAIEAGYGERARGVVAVTITDDGSAQHLVATDAAVILRAPFAVTNLVVGHTALPFGQVAQLHRHELAFPDQPLPVRVLLGADGLRGTGIQLRTARTFSGAVLSLDLAAADRFGARVDSLHPGEPPDQSIAGVTAGGRLGAGFAAMRSRFDVGVSSITGKREQPIGCVYDATVGPVPCPEAVNAANTRLTVLGADARMTWGGDALVVSGEWMRMVVGATDLPVFSNNRFAAYYRGVSGTYDGGYVGARARATSWLGVGARGEWLQNPEVGGMNDAWAGGYLDFSPLPDAHVTASYQRRVPSSAALATMTTAERDARDRIVLRGTVVIGRHPRAGRE